MPRKVSRDELILMLEELDRGESTHDQLQQMVEALELAVSDAEALDIMQDDELTNSEIADQLIGYSDLDA